MKLFVIHMVLYFLLYLILSVSLEAFLWRVELIDKPYLMQQVAIAAIWAVVMSLFHAVYKKARRKKVQ